MKFGEGSRKDWDGLQNGLEFGKLAVRSVELMWNRWMGYLLSSLKPQRLVL